MIMIKQPVTKEDFKNYYALRYQVLREPWGQQKGTEKDDFEPISQHFMAVNDEQNEIIGVIKMFEKEAGIAQFSHMAVAIAWQRKGIGRTLVEAVEKAAHKQGYKTIGAMSRLTATKYFERLGYHVKGLPSHYFGTTQVVWMEKDLTA